MEIERFFSFIDKKKYKKDLISEKLDLEKNSIIERKNYLLSEYPNFDYYDILIKKT